MGIYVIVYILVIHVQEFAYAHPFLSIISDAVGFPKIYMHC